MSPCWLAAYPSRPSAYGRRYVHPLAAVVVEDDGSGPTPVRALQDRAFAVAAVSRAHRANLTFGLWPQWPPRETSANVLEGTVLRVPCQTVTQPCRIRPRPASAADTSAERVILATMPRTVSIVGRDGNGSK